MEFDWKEKLKELSEFTPNNNSVIKKTALN